MVYTQVKLFTVTVKNRK